jgi:hypothetical protein
MDFLQDDDVDFHHTAEAFRACPFPVGARRSVAAPPAEVVSRIFVPDYLPSVTPFHPAGAFPEDDDCEMVLR